MTQSRPSAFSSLRMGGKHILCARQRPLTNNGTEVIREKVQDGETGEYKDLAYTQCKIVGNGSFGVVFQTKLSPSGEDAAIKRVLQDKRFKVSLLMRHAYFASFSDHL
jgi:glycogen synthase kinase 3 beta